MPNIPLEKMSVEEKLQAMELLWTDLCSRADSVESPSWHGEVLANTDAAVARGEITFEDWDAAKRKIAKEIE